MKIKEKGIDKKLLHYKINEIEHKMKCILEKKKECEEEYEIIIE